MMFLFAVPVMQGLGISSFRLMVGARSIAFPRLVAFSYWMLLFGGVFLYVSFALNAGPDVGWFAYTVERTAYTPASAPMSGRSSSRSPMSPRGRPVSLITTASSSARQA